MNRLTKRQKEVLIARCDLGESMEECAYRLGISRNTAVSHGVTVLRKLGLRTFFQVCTEYGRQTADVPQDKP